MAVRTLPAATAQISYQDLYARWERGNWSATELDFSQDRIDWHERMTQPQRDAALWLFTLFFHGEDAVTDTLSPYVDAAPTEEQTYFLTTQQVDEARHSVFFKRFMDEVVDLGDGTVGGGMRATDHLITWGHRKVFGHLDEVADRLRKDRSKVNLARSVTLYHLVIEGMLAQPTQHAIDNALTELDVLPGFREGMRNVSLDEQRHIAFGVRLLADLYAELGQPVEDAIVGKIREVLPWTSAVALPPGRDFDFTKPIGIDLYDVFTEGALLQEQRLRAVGLDLDRVERFPLPLDLPPRARAERGLKLLEAGMLGPKEGPVSRDPEAAEILMDTLRRSADRRPPRRGRRSSGTSPTPSRGTCASTTARRPWSAGRAATPDLTLRCSYDDWVDVMAGREDPRKLMLTRRLRPRGSLRVLARMSRIFPD